MCEVTLYKKMSKELPVEFTGNSQEEILGRVEQWMDDVDDKSHCNGLTIIHEEDHGTVLINDPKFEEDWYIGPLHIEDGDDVLFPCFKDALARFLQLVKQLVQKEEDYGRQPIPV